MEAIIVTAVLCTFVAMVGTVIGMAWLAEDREKEKAKQEQKEREAWHRDFKFQVIDLDA